MHAHGHGLITRAVDAGLLFCDGLGVYTTKMYRPGFPHVLEIENRVGGIEQERSRRTDKQKGRFFLLKKRPG